MSYSIPDRDSVGRCPGASGRGVEGGGGSCNDEHCSENNGQEHSLSTGGWDLKKEACLHESGCGL
jgi:hypothetical protein